MSIFFESCVRKFFLESSKILQIHSGNCVFRRGKYKIFRCAGQEERKGKKTIDFCWWKIFSYICRGFSETKKKTLGELLMYVVITMR